MLQKIKKSEFVKFRNDCVEKCNHANETSQDEEYCVDVDFIDNLRKSKNITQFEKCINSDAIWQYIKAGITNFAFTNTYEMEGHVISALILNNKEQINHCIVSFMNGSDWSRVLQKYPEFENRCGEWRKFDAIDIRDLVRKQPQFAKYLKFDDIAGNILNQILKIQPQLIEFCDTPSNFLNPYANDSREIILEKYRKK
jgi:hypothetical protein